jgi:hypothetical protein
MLWFRPVGTDPVVESRARDQARWLIRDNGDDAESVLTAKLKRPGVSPADIYRYKLTARELSRLRRKAEVERSQPAIRQPRLFTAGKLLSFFFGVRAIDRRKSPRD